MLAGVRTCASPKAGDTCRVKILNDCQCQEWKGVEGWRECKGVERDRSGCEGVGQELRGKHIQLGLLGGPPALLTCCCVSVFVVCVSPNAQT